MNERKTCHYQLTDADHNAYRCSACGHIEQFEADGPYENGWNVCPHCCLPIEHQISTEETGVVE